jgi:hypothetical protein
MPDLERNPGDPRARYPDASEMPEINTPEEPGAPADMGSHPVVQAIQTLTEFVLSQEGKGNPKAAVMKDALQSFMKTMGAGSETPEGEAPIPERGMPPPEEEIEEPEPEIQAREGIERDVEEGRVAFDPFKPREPEKTKKPKMKSEKNKSAIVLT